MILRVAVAVAAYALCLAAQSWEQQTSHALTLLLNRQFDQLYAMFGPEMRQAITQEAFAQSSEQILGLGKPASLGKAETRTVMGGPLVVIPLHWPSASLNFQVSWSADGKIRGLFFRPATPGTSPSTLPPYADAASFTQREVTVGEDRWKLPGTLTVPKGKGPFPAVVLVHGSGPHDRDETVGAMKPFRDLAAGLASRGIAVLRYVKRTKQYNDPDAGADLTQEAVIDALRAVELLRRQPEVNPGRVYVLGHSMGGFLVPRILRQTETVAGAVVLAGLMRSVVESIVDQTEYLASLNGPPDAAAQARLEKVRQDPWSALTGISASYRRDLETYDPAGDVKQTRVSSAGAAGRA